jgi:predicted RecA/RadA family phage recombinase
MTERKIRFPNDVWAAIELTAKREGISAAEVVRVGALSYAAFSLARAGDEASDAMAGLFDVARRTVDAWPL